jgi:hypothetical protein
MEVADSKCSAEGEYMAKRESMITPMPPKTRTKTTLSLAPLSVDEALAALLKTPLPPKGALPERSKAKAARTRKRPAGQRAAKKR